LNELYGWDYNLFFLRPQVEKKKSNPQLTKIERTKDKSVHGENFFNSSRPCHPCYPNVMKLFVVTFADAKSLFSEF
jgi:hypothetical protein